MVDYRPKKGIILSGGTGSRLFPLTKVVNKQLLPVYDKPMIYYPLATLISLGIRDICIISNEQSILFYKTLFSDSNLLGLNISFEVQDQPNGIAESFLIAEKFIGEDNVCLILGDNIFHGLPKINLVKNEALIFAYDVSDPQRYGVVEIGENNKAISIEEKPSNPKSNYAIPGLYFYDNKVVEYAKNLKPSIRGELEITDINKIYLINNKLNVVKLPRGVAWLDAGTPESLFQSASYVQAVQERQGIKIGCIEEECYKQGLINDQNLEKLMNKAPNSEYRSYLKKVLL